MQFPTGHKYGRVFIVAGEASGDNYGSLLIREIKELRPGVEVWAVGGDRMQRAGARLISHYSEISVVGLVEVAGKLGNILRLLREIKGYIRGGEIECLVLIDFPDFNFLVGKYARKYNVPVIYYIPPQMWAWRQGRARILNDISREIVVPFPFEVDFYRQRNIDVHYFGHPLMEMLVQEDRYRNHSDGAHETEKATLRIGFFPGSRDTEVVRHLPLMLGAGRILKKNSTEVEFYLYLAHRSLRENIDGILGGFEHEVHVVTKEDHQVVGNIDGAIASSGTVTLELAVYGIPTVIIYKVSPLTYIIGKLLVSAERVGLPNIVTGETVFPELIQGRATPDMIAGEIQRLLSDPVAIRKIGDTSLELRQAIGGDATSMRVAELVTRELKC